jgi:dUTP pyrophosphatase
MEDNSIPVKIISHNLPLRATAGSAGYDIFLQEDVHLLPNSITKIPTQLKIAIPNGYYIDIRPRSSVSSEGISISGVIDSDYTGEIYIIASNPFNQSKVFSKGSRIAQMLFIKCATVNFTQVNALSKTSRGENGFGSSDILENQ